jgi:hypothetical protein
LGAEYLRRSKNSKHLQLLRMDQLEAEEDAIDEQTAKLRQLVTM